MSTGTAPRPVRSAGASGFEPRALPVVRVPETREPASEASLRPAGVRWGRATLAFVALGLALGALAMVAAGTGQLSIPPLEVASSVLRQLGIETGLAVSHPHGESALWQVRFPRIFLAVFVGAGLSVAGVLMQGIFGNPLAEPGTVGVSAGAAVGACATIVFGWAAFGNWTIAAMAFVGGLAATLVAYSTARVGGRTEVVTLVLTGVAVAAVSGALTAYLVFVGDTQSREEIIFWQLGSLNGTRWGHVLVAAPLIILGTVFAVVIARKLDLLALGERSARHLGVDVERLRLSTIVVVAVLTGAAVAFCGVIGFVGLVVPHLLRMILGPAHRTLVPASALGGAVLLLGADLAARTVVPYADLPIGMLTAAVGGPFFFWLLRRTRRGAGGWA